MKKYTLVISKSTKKYCIYEYIDQSCYSFNFRRIFEGKGFNHDWVCTIGYYENELKENYIVAENDNLEELKQQIYLELL